LPFDVSEGKKTIIIPAEFNVLGEGERSAARILRVVLVTMDGDIKRSTSYLVESEFRLAVMQNSFMTIEAAEILARDVPNLSGWRAAGDDERHAALIEAYNRLTRIPMRFRVVDPAADVPLESDIYAEETIILRSAWIDISVEEFNAWPLFFRRSLRQAQLIEANELLEGDDVTKRVRAGIISETIGESSVTLRAGHVDFGLSRPTLSCLAGLIYYNHRIVRA
jgi:hypothetical protein